MYYFCWYVSFFSCFPLSYPHLSPFLLHPNHRLDHQTEWNRIGKKGIKLGRIIVIQVKWLISVRSGLCTSSQLGGFITSLPTDMRLNETSIYTTPLKFAEGSFPTPTPPAEDQPEEEPIPTPEGSGEILEEGEILDNMKIRSDIDDKRGKRQWDIIESITDGVKGASPSSSSSDDVEDATVGTEGGGDGEGSGERQDEGSGGAVYEVPTYSGAVHYKVPKTGYYCVGTSLSIHFSSCHLTPLHLVPFRSCSSSQSLSC